MQFLPGRDGRCAQACWQQELAAQLILPRLLRAVSVYVFVCANSGSIGQLLRLAPVLEARQVGLAEAGSFPRPACRHG